MQNFLDSRGESGDAVAGAATVLVISYMIGRFVLDYFVHPPGFRYLASALGLDIGDGHVTLLLHVGYFLVICLVLVGAYYIGGELFETSDDIR